MTDNQDRRVRLRLARRRPAPGRVRARVRDQEPTPITEPDEAPRRQTMWERLESVPLVHGLTVAGTVIAIVAGIAGLWFQAVATYWSQQTSRDQLTQSKKEGEREEREQAMKVNFWRGGETRTGDQTVHVVNRSPDPITSVFLDLMVIDADSDVYASFESYIPPCTEVVFSTSNMQAHRYSTKGSKTVGSKWFVNDIVFVDRDGQTWKRTTSGLTKMRPTDARLGDRRVRAGTLRLEKDPTTKKADNCGDSSA